MRSSQLSRRPVAGRAEQMRQDLDARAPRLQEPGSARRESLLPKTNSRSRVYTFLTLYSSVANIEITLSSDSEFFHLLTSELASLEAFQSRTEAEIKSNVVAIASAVTGVAAPKSANSKSDLYPWREIFRVYVESGIFFSNLESENHQERTVEKAQEQLTWFNSEVRRLGLLAKFKNAYSPHLLRRFMDINTDILRVMRFQAINKLAMAKILKSKSLFPSLCVVSRSLASSDKLTVWVRIR